MTLRAAQAGADTKRKDFHGVQAARALHGGLIGSGPPVRLGSWRQIGGRHRSLSLRSDQSVVSADGHRAILAGEVTRAAPLLWPPGTPRRHSQAAAECSILIGGSRGRLNVLPERVGITSFAAAKLHDVPVIKPRVASTRLRKPHLLLEVREDSTPSCGIMWFLAVMLKACFQC